MNDLSITGALCVRPRRARGFWRRQFGEATTPAQRRFDVAFGVVLPVLCFAFDPVVFRGHLFGGVGFYGQFQFYAYTLSAMEIVALCVWLFPAGPRARRTPALAGVLLAGGVFSFALGLMILPLTLIGLIFLVGVLGFVPFATALVYLRSGWRAAGLVRGGEPFRAGALAALACGFTIALGAPVAAHMSFKWEVEAALANVREGRELAPARLRALRVGALVSGVAVYDDLLSDYQWEKNPARRARMAEAYEEITGVNIERRLAILAD